MALYGVVGDIHGNCEALQAALTCLGRRGVDRILCVGDIIGYNADPDACAALLRDHHALAIAGNHDLIGIGRLGYDRCSNKAAYSLRRTRRQLTAETAAYLGSLPAHRVIEGRILLVHGGIRDVEQYLATPRHIRENAAYLRSDFPGTRVCLFGHTHERKVYELDGDEVRELPIAETVRLRGDRVYFVNPGSIDAARKRGHKLAEWAVFDSSKSSLEFYRLAYDHAVSESKATASGYRINPWTDSLYSLYRRFMRWRRAMG